MGRHLVASERMMRRAVETGEVVQSDVDVAEAPDLESLARLLETEREATIHLIQELDGQALDRVLPVTAEGGKRLYVTVEEFLLTMAAHESWHTGQISWANLIQRGE